MKKTSYPNTEATTGKNTDPGRRTLRVQKILRHTPELFELFLEREDFAFVPGDCVSIFAVDGETSRPYSIASGTGESLLSFLIKQMDDGVVTGHLANLQPGDRVTVSLPYGWFRPGQSSGDAPFIFIATGTGIAPFLSYLRSNPQRPPAQVLYGVRRTGDAVGYTELQNSCPVQLAVSREEQPPFFHGRVNCLLAELHYSPTTHFYLCGLDAMIDELTNWLETHGTPPEQIHTEVFFHAPHQTQ